MLTVVFLWLMSGLTPGLTGQACRGHDCLQSYVARPEPSYRWEDLGQRLEGEDWTGYVVNFTSQQWLSPLLVSRAEWWHILLLIIPHRLTVRQTGLLWITGGSNDHQGPEVDIQDPDVQMMANIAVSNQMVTAVLFQVPNQPIVFSEDGLQEERKEDGIIAFTWWHFITQQPNNPEYLLRLPMTKAAVKAMDTITYFLTDDTLPEELQALGLDPQHFIVGGASKRGWTTWSVATVDPRVVGILPTVMDELNFIKNIKHHWRSLGGWTWQFEDYWKLNLTTYFEEAAMQEMFDIVDSYESRELMLMPKLVICAANDEFFLPTDSQYWWREMPQESELNRLLFLPNSGHHYHDQLAARLGSVSSWLGRIIPGEESPARTGEPEMPRFSWSEDSVTGDITVRSHQTSPVRVELWSAPSCSAHRRDWRAANLDSPCECGPAQDGLCLNQMSDWRAETLQQTADNTWVAHRDPPEDGRYLAFYVTLHYNISSGETGGHLEFSTTVSVVPATFPFPDCTGEQCRGTLV